MAQQPRSGDAAPSSIRSVVSYADSALSDDITNPLNQRFGILVTEIASRIDPLATVLNRHGITKTQWAKLKTLPAFQNALLDQEKAFASVSNLPARIKLKAQLLTETLLDEMFEIARHIAYPASARVSAFAQIKNLTGLEKPEDAAPQRAFNLTINLAGGRTKTAQAVTLEAVADRDAIAEDRRYILSQGADDGQPIDGGDRDFDDPVGTVHHSDTDFEPEAPEEDEDVSGGFPTPEPRPTWSSFSRVQPGPELSRAPAPPSYEASHAFTGAEGGLVPGGPEIAPVATGPQLGRRPTTSLRSALAAAKSSNDGG